MLPSVSCRRPQRWRQEVADVRLTLCRYFPRVEPCTHGIWLWHVDDAHLPATPMLPRGATVLLLDTEGLGSYTKTETYDIQVRLLAADG